MPSPFPGMDPYLEAPALWRDVHHRLISGIAEHLNSSLPENYVARINERLYLDEPDPSDFPDQFIASVRTHNRNRLRSSETPWKVSVAPPEEIAEAFVEVQQLRPERRLVAIIEVVSPSNKRPNTNARESYLKKQQEIREQGIALLELDLLRGGAHTVEAPLEALQRFGTWDYLACLRRAGRRYDWEVWPIRLREPLPEVYVPLADEHSDLPLPLQPLVDCAYQGGRYSLLVDYQKEPRPPLSEENTGWAWELLRPQRDGTEKA